MNSHAPIAPVHLPTPLLSLRCGAAARRRPDSTALVPAGFFQDMLEGGQSPG